MPMNAAPTESTAERPLEILGIGEAEERAYRWLLTHSGASAGEMAHGLGLTRAKAQRLIDAIESKGLATHTPTRPRQYLATSPDIALEALALKHQEKLRQVRGTINELQQYTASGRHRGDEHVVELVNNHEAESQIFADLHRSAQHEILTLTRPPMRVTRLDMAAEKLARLQEEAQARGVVYRSVVDEDFLSSPGAAARIHRETGFGEQFRATHSLPFKMVVADRRIAIIPLHLEQPDSASLLVRSSALLDALCAMFEMIWERAVPMAFTPSGSIEIDSVDGAPDFHADALVSLMAAGLNDKTIAGELDISASTLNRRIAKVMHAFNARTRFQLGWLARGSDAGIEKAAGKIGAGKYGDTKMS